ncbi:hypothetical protein L9F63_007864, partial [Diploptera punctata]
DANVNVTPTYSTESTITETTILTSTKQLDIVTDITPSTKPAQDDAIEESETTLPVTITTVNQSQIKQAIIMFQHVTAHTTDSTTQAEVTSDKPILSSKVTGTDGITVTQDSTSVPTSDKSNSSSNLTGTDAITITEDSTLVPTSYKPNSSSNLTGMDIITVTEESTSVPTSYKPNLSTNLTGTDVITVTEDSTPVPTSDKPNSSSNLTGIDVITVTEDSTPVPTSDQPNSSSNLTGTDVITVTEDSTSAPTLTVTTGNVSDTEVTTIHILTTADVTTTNNSTYKMVATDITESRETSSTTDVSNMYDVETSVTLLDSTQPRVQSTDHSEAATSDTETTVIVPDTTQTNATSSDVTKPVSTTTVVAITVKNGIISTVSSAFQSTESPVTQKDNETCQKSECKVVASRMLSMMNHSIKPCDNFYEFACGGLRDNHGLLQEDPAQDVWNRISIATGQVHDGSYPVYQKFLHFYDQCVDYEHTVNQSERLKLANNMLSQVGNMYNTTEWAEADTFNLTDILIQFFSLD